MRDPVRRWRLIVIAVALVVFAVKVVLASTTYGTNDINHWHDFVDGVRSAGPIGIYGIDFPHSLYNHGPLTGYLLEVVNGFGRLGVPFNAAIRIGASLADIGSAVLIFELVRAQASSDESGRPRVSVVTAGWSGVAVAASPLLIIISGFHGNTDPILVLLLLLSGYLAGVRRRPLAAGIALGLAVSIKVVAIVAVPALLIWGWRRSRRALVHVLVGLTLVVIGLWGPPLIGYPRAVLSHVFGYGGGTFPQWGVGEWASLVGGPGLVTFVTGPVRLLFVAAAAALGGWVAWRRPASVPAALGLSLLALLVLTPSFGFQYLVWGLAVGYLLAPRLATVFNLAGGLLLFVVYTRQDKGLPWDRAYSDPMQPGERLAALAVWASLAGVLGLYLWRLRSSQADSNQTEASLAAVSPPMAGGQVERSAVDT